MQKTLKLDKGAIRYLEFGQSNPIKAIIIPGTFAEPSVYEPFAEKLAEHDVHSLIPHLPSRQRICNLVTIDDYADEADVFISMISEENPDFTSVHTMGHSRGASIAFAQASKGCEIQTISAYGCVVPVDYSFSEYFARYWKTNMEGNAVGPDRLKYILSSLKAFAIAPRQNVGLVQDVMDYTFNFIPDIPVLVAIGLEDGYFHEAYETMEEDFVKFFPHPGSVLWKIEGANHAYCINKAEEAAKRTASFIKGQLK